MTFNIETLFQRMLLLTKDHFIRIDEQDGVCVINNLLKL